MHLPNNGLFGQGSRQSPFFNGLTSGFFLGRLGNFRGLFPVHRRLYHHCPAQRLSRRQRTLQERFVPRFAHGGFILSKVQFFKN
jgi:hypothetical protein